MNIVDGACSQCGASTYYDGTLPILCKSCRSAIRAELKRLADSTTQYMDTEGQNKVTQPKSENLMKQRLWKEYMMSSTRSKETVKAK